MALERMDPIPPGVYWIDAFKMTLPNGENQDKLFNDWLAANRATVKIIRTVHYDGQLARPGATAGGADISGAYPARDWVLFEVLKPTPRWKVDTRLGFPTRAPKGAATVVEDTSQRPPPGDDSIIPWGWIFAGAGIAAGAFLLLDWAKSKIPAHHEDHHG